MTVIWLILALVTAMAEALTVQMVSIWFTVGAVGACITSLFTDNIIIQIGVFVVLTLAALLVTRPLVQKLRATPPEPTNADRYIGRTAVVVSEIDNDRAAGQVKVDNSVWSARSADGSVIPKGAKTKVASIEGVKLIVQEYNSNSEI